MRTLPGPLGVPPKDPPPVLLGVDTAAGEPVTLPYHDLPYYERVLGVAVIGKMGHRQILNPGTAHPR